MLKTYDFHKLTPYGDKIVPGTLVRLRGNFDSMGIVIAVGKRHVVVEESFSCISDTATVLWSCDPDSWIYPGGGVINLRNVRTAGRTLTFTAGKGIAPTSLTYDEATNQWEAKSVP